jgi:hypothetical protein
VLVVDSTLIFGDLGYKALAFFFSFFCFELQALAPREMV